LLFNPLIYLIYYFAIKLFSDDAIVLQNRIINYKALL
jgi:hypothetical protein